jgi:hypothetical protein
MTKQVFLSYSRKDSAMMRRVKKRLEQAGLSVWTDETGIRPGTESWKKAIEDAIEVSVALVVLLSPDAKESKWVGEEINYAQLCGLKVFPLLVRGDQFTSVPFGLSATQWIDLRDDFDPGMKKLIKEFENQGWLAKPKESEAPKPLKPVPETEKISREAKKTEAEEAKVTETEAVEQIVEEKKEPEQKKSFSESLRAINFQKWAWGLVPLAMIIGLALFGGQLWDGDDEYQETPGEQAARPIASPTPTIEISNKIAFQSDRDGDDEIFIMNSDGSNLVQLTDNSDGDSHPTWSPDGSKIAFRSNRDGDWEIFTMNSDGSDVVQLTDDSYSNAFPSWSPDGRQIAFSSDRDDDWEIFIMNSDGSNLVQLTDNSYTDDFPSWSPDGDEIAFSPRDGDDEIFIMNSDGSNLVQLTDNSFLDRFPSWSPDGQNIAFSSHRDDDWEIFIMNSDGSNLVQLTDNSYTDFYSSWSPDGSKIVFASDRDGDWEIFIMNSDGSNVVQLTDNSVEDKIPSWSP